MLRLATLLMTALAMAVSALPANAQRAQGYGQLDIIETGRVRGGVDTLGIGIGRDAGRMEALAIRPLDRPLRIRALNIVFGNGKSQRVKIDQWLDEEQVSPVVDLKGDRRFIRRVEVLFRPMPSGRSARIQILGVPARRELSVVESVRVRRGDDVITYNLGRDYGRFSTVAFRALDRRVRVRGIEITFGNGERQAIRMRDTLSDGDVTQAIDLKGDRRFIRRIDVLIRPKLGRGVARLQLLADADTSGGPRRPDRPRQGRGVEGQWVLLGTQRAGLFRKDDDFFAVGKDKGRFRAIKVTAKGHDIRIYRMQLTYGNGTAEEIPLRGTIEDGHSTNPFDLKGEARYINNIKLRYRTKLNFKGSGRIEIYGLRVGR